MLTIVGDVSLDLVMGPVDGWPAIGTETIMERSELRPGGSGGNTALAARHLGAPCRLLSRVGDDALGGWLAEQFHGIEASLPASRSATSISTGVIHTCGERTIFTTRGHLEHLSWADLRPHLAPAPQANAIVLLTGAFLLPRLRVDYREVITEIRGLGYAVALDTGWPPRGWDASTRAEAWAWISGCDHVLFNEAEVTGLADRSDLDEAMAELAARLPPEATLVAKTGPRGARGVQNARTESYPTPNVDVFDTIGAGDSFNAGYLLARLRGQPLGASLRAGCEAAAAIISRFPRQEIAPGELAFKDALSGT